MIKIYKQLFIIFFVSLVFINNCYAMKEWEKEVYRKTKDVKRIPATLAYQMFLSGKSLVISVDRENEYKNRRIVESINIPKSKLTDSFIKKNKSKFQKYKYIILYCR